MAHQAPETQHTPGGAFERLVTIIDTLRVECPWDRKQTMESLRLLSIEELYELTDAILDKDYDEVKKELGDVMVHLVFYAKIASEQKQFDIVDSLNAVCDKLITRHPHIYGDVEAETEDVVKSNWEQIKLKEGNRSVLSGVPKGLPALVKAYRIQDKVRGVGFDWEDKTEVWAKVEEELEEFKNEFNLTQGEEIDQDRAEAEFGDLLFSLINYGRHLGLNPENALERTNKKFIFRFNHLEKRASENGQQLKDMSLAEMDVYWNEAKKL
ncbi:nucleoside triphosphate pyrophosphohydrolase [Sphingobacterium psychroaquaticum]|uniref:Nucleoside triphosphate pyrophosphohydrolase n=1 Tax=Sphingobacterium psychroaquaticum TaxID=561061 RepID=A0A1X7IK14_9SPHI|nr:nucleoside triphosphate pyrophosphohydrolase [Sphingobacterium psychroaquaticum]QBQ41445.1 nucleoside triphosphate pyrophosphohydrolase [Sphingobacterium psychroaquaticum]SMG15135.1 XTP/dITP diphosphohydrolase [Sphingobacterium psychroaquaticum]